MVFILTAQLEKDCVTAHRRYEEYLRANEAVFPKSAYALATSDWYWDATVSGCPHDGWLQRLTITETPKPSSDPSDRAVQITIDLLAPYHDGVIKFHYPRVHRYRISAFDLDLGHRDWRYNEFRVDESGKLIHEIEWWGPEGTATWIIGASDVLYEWSPINEGVLHTNKATM